MEPRPDFSTQVALRAFSRPAPVGQLRFDDRLLVSYRHRHEWLALGVAVLAVLAIIVAVSVLSAMAGVAVVALLILTATVTRLKAAQQLARAAEVTPTQFAHLYPMVEELRQRFAMPETRVFVTQSAVINAASSGLQAPYVIVLNSALVDAFEADELKSVIGHEMGHIRFGHTQIAALLGGVGTRGLVLPFPINLVAAVRDLVVLWWQRCTEMSADRAGILACGRLSTAISAQVKLSVGPTLHQYVNLADLAEQSVNLNTGMRRVEGFLSQLGESHPFLVNRIQAMLDFVSLAESEAQAEAESESEKTAGLPSPPTARLVIADAQGGLDYPLGRRPLLAGRSPSADIRLRDRTVSRRHFEVAWESDRYMVRDLGSNNGTLLNGRRITLAELHDGDVIQAGFIDLKFHAG